MSYTIHDHIFEKFGLTLEEFNERLTYNDKITMSLLMTLIQTYADTHSIEPIDAVREFIMDCYGIGIDQAVILCKNDGVITIAGHLPEDCELKIKGRE
jgi:hypothetical protein